MTTYPRIQSFDSRRQGESIDSYGARALVYILHTSCVMLIDDEGIQQADRVSQIAVSAREISATALENIQSARGMIGGELRRRAKNPAPFAAVPAGPRAGSGGGSRVLAGVPVPTIPPSDGDALAIPTLTVSPGAQATIDAIADGLAVDRKTVPATRPAMADIVSQARRDRRTFRIGRSLTSVAPLAAGDDIL